MSADDGQWIDVNNQAVHLVDQPGCESYGGYINVSLCLVAVILWTAAPKDLPQCTDCLARQQKTRRTS